MKHTIIPCPKVKAPDPKYIMATAAQRIDAHRAAIALMNGFDWSDSYEGHDFWNAVKERLANIANTTEPVGERNR